MFLSKKHTSYCHLSPFENNLLIISHHWVIISGDNRVTIAIHHTSYYHPPLYPAPNLIQQIPYTTGIFHLSCLYSSIKTPTLLVVHGRGNSWSRPWAMLSTTVIRPVHVREQLIMSASYSYFPYGKKQECKRLKRTLVLSYGWLHYRQQTNHPFSERWKIGWKMQKVSFTA